MFVIALSRHSVDCVTQANTAIHWLRTVSDRVCVCVCVCLCVCSLHTVWFRFGVKLCHTARWP